MRPAAAARPRPRGHDRRTVQLSRPGGRGNSLLTPGEPQAGRAGPNNLRNFGGGLRAGGRTRPSAESDATGQSRFLFKIRFSPTRC
eukprot:759985-Hanusia_phi.AAC.1